MNEQQLVGLDYLSAATALLHRARRAHPTKGLYEAADLQWWWRSPRSTDHLGQLFWFDQLGRPSAAVIATDWGDRIALDPIVLPDATSDWVAHVIDRGLELEVLLAPVDGQREMGVLSHRLPLENARLAPCRRCDARGARLKECDAHVDPPAADDDGRRTVAALRRAYWGV